jgi:hypothetical protein
MKTISLILFLIVLSFTVKSQSSILLHRDFSIIPKNTGIKAYDYSPRKVVTAFDLALNLSFLHNLSQSVLPEYLTLPIVLINDVPVEESRLSKINISDVTTYRYIDGNEASALYGTRGLDGVLFLYLKDDKK